jgi:CRISPR system Cascade subunit CasE
MHISEFVLDCFYSRNPYEIHRLLWSFFPGAPDDDRSFLYRVTYGKRGEPLRLLMQSFIAPDMNVRVKGCVLLRTKEFRPSLRESARYRFLLCANPIKRLCKERCRLPLIDEDQLLVWLAHKLEPAAEIESADIAEKRNLYFRKEGEAGKIAIVTFAGVLKVLSSEKVADLIKKGIGPAKAFGCGLISLARV